MDQIAEYANCNEMAVAPSEKYVVIGVKRLQEKEQVIKDDVMELLNRLEPVLTSENPMAKVCKEDNIPEMSLHAVQLYQVGDGLYNIHLMLSEILGRLDL